MGQHESRAGLVGCRALPSRWEIRILYQVRHLRPAEADLTLATFAPDRGLMKVVENEHWTDGEQACLHWQY